MAQQCSTAPAQGDNTTSPFILIGSDHSLYTGKLRSYLIWRGLPFVELTASSEVYRNVILPRTGVAFIPVLVLPDHTTVLQDTHAIISYLEQQLKAQLQQQHNSTLTQQPPPSPTSHQTASITATTTTTTTSSSSSSNSHPGQLSVTSTLPAVTQPRYHAMAGPCLPSTAKAAAASQLLELYGDEWLLLPAMHYRWSFPQQRQKLLYQFGSTNMPTGWYQRQLAAGAKVAARFSGMLPGLGITPDSIPVIEARFDWQLAVLQEHFTHHAYLLGSTQPTTADFGFIGPLLAHLYVDPVPSCILQCAAPLVADYIERLGGLHCRSRVVDRVLQHGGGTAAVLAAPLGATAAAQPAAAAGGCAAAAGGVGAPSQAAGGEGAPAVQCSRLPVVYAGLQPAEGEPPLNKGHQQPAGGHQQLLLKVLVQHQQPQSQQSQQLQEGMSSGPAASAVDCVPRSVLPLLHHMFLEQVPVIISSLQLLKAWSRRQQQKQPCAQDVGASPNPAVNTDATAAGGGGPSGRRGGGRWLAVPRFLGMHAFVLHDVVTGAPGPATLQRAASSYVAWRAAEIVCWYQQLPAADQGAVQQLLQEISSSSSSSCATRGSGHQAVDAVKAFGEMQRLVGECGRIARRGNKVVVWCEPAGDANSSTTTSKL